MLALVLDFETQTADPTTTPVTEVGAVLVKLNVSASTPWKEREHPQLETFSQLVYHPGYPPQTKEVEELTGISDELLKREGQLPRAVFAHGVLPLVRTAQLVIAHNKKFDKTVLESVCARLAKSAPEEERCLYEVPEREWLCTLEDFPWPKKYRCKQLAHLAFDHGLRMEGRDLHRAIHDCELLLELITTRYDMAEVLAYAREPWVYLKADTVPPWTDGGASTTLAKETGYSYERARYTDHPSFPKTWVKRVKSRQVEEEKALAKLPISVLT